MKPSPGVMQDVRCCGSVCRRASVETGAGERSAASRVLPHVDPLHALPLRGVHPPPQPAPTEAARRCKDPASIAVTPLQGALRFPPGRAVLGPWPAAPVLRRRLTHVRPSAHVCKRLVARLLVTSGCAPPGASRCRTAKGPRVDVEREAAQGGRANRFDSSRAARSGSLDPTAAVNDRIVIISAWEHHRASRFLARWAVSSCYWG